MTSNPLRDHWLLDPKIAFLNHGSFGACPKPVLALQSELRDRMEREPVQFLLGELSDRLAAVRTKVAEFVGAQPEDLVFTRNATEGVNAVLRSLSFAPGDEILTTDHVYGACRNAARFIAETSGATLKLAQVPFPLSDPAQVTEAIIAEVTPRTKLALIDHVTSATGLVWPIQEIVTQLKLRGVETLVDGAHAPGMVGVNIEALGAAYYAANFHKWVCSPKGAALLWVRKDLQTRVFPTSISHGYARPEADRYLALFDWTGTQDPTPWLCVPAALDFMAGLCPGGWPEVRTKNRELALTFQRLLCDALNIEPPAPESMIGSLTAVPLPDSTETVGPYSGRARAAPDPLYFALFDRGFETLIGPWPQAPSRLLRVSAQLYNTRAEVERLGQELKILLNLG